MDIQWYPGHMKKTRDLISTHIKLVDIVVELLDARAPLATINPQFDDLLGHKKRLVILNKADLADEQVNRLWKQQLEAEHKAVLLYNAKSDPPKVLLERIQQAGRFVHEKNVQKGQNKRAIRAMVIGIPNVGKSSLINRLIGKSSAKTGNKPGVTKGKQWLRLSGDVDLFDTPGILWPKFENMEQAVHLALIGSIKDELLDRFELAMELIRVLQEHYSHVFRERYGVGDEQGEALLEAIARKRGCLLPGNNVDIERVSRLIVDEFRSGALGRISLERP